MIRVLLTFLLLNTVVCFADDYLIQEMETLKDSLTYDDPARNELTLRLADLYFETSIKEGMDLDHERKNKALILYKSALEGTDGLKAVEGKLRIKVNFQVARILEKLKRDKEAIKIFEEVYSNQNTPKEIKRESAFSLAAWYEEKASFSKANEFYSAAISLCSTIDTCNFAHYKRGWLLYKEVKLDEAIAELKLSLWDSKGQIRDKVLQDYIMFMSNRITDGISELKELEDLEKKTGKNDLVITLAESFYTAGNRQAGAHLLSHIDKKAPSPYYKIRLLEENYGFRNWDKFNSYLSALEKVNASELPTKKEQAKEVVNILRRLVVQLDAEVVNNKDAVKYLKRSIDLYLKYYPRDEMRKKMMSGWLKMEDDQKKKIARLDIWIGEEVADNSPKDEIIKLRQNRLSMAQKEKMNEIVISEAMAIAALFEGSSEAREFEYVAAREYYGMKNYDKALPLFKSLAAIKDKADKWSVLSQNLVLDIYNQQKNYQAIIGQVDSWSKNENIKHDSVAKKELGQMSMVAKQAKFEMAASQGETKEALETFFSFCMAGEFADKSCLNAKVLSVKLEDQQKLVYLLEKEKDEKALMVEYELMGRFSEAAKLQEKFNLNSKATLEDYLKISLLYELDFNFQNRDRILTKMVSKIKKDKEIDFKMEPLIYMTLSEAGLINEKSLSIPWSLKTKLRLAHRLEVKNSNKKTQKIILSQNESMGPAWGKLILTKLQKLDEAQSKISFYGRRSKTLFKRRTDKLTAFNEEAKKHLEGARSETRIYILDMLVNAYNNLSQEILNTPLPKDLDEETLKMVQGNLKQMSDPFVQVASDYLRLQNEQLKAVSDLEKRNAIAANIKQEKKDYTSFITFESKDYPVVASIDSNKPKAVIEKLKVMPKNPLALKELEDYYKANKSARLAAYFTGRLSSLQK